MAENNVKCEELESLKVGIFYDFLAVTRNPFNKFLMDYALFSLPFENYQWTVFCKTKFEISYSEQKKLFSTATYIRHEEIKGFDFYVDVEPDLPEDVSVELEISHRIFDWTHRFKIQSSSLSSPLKKDLPDSVPTYGPFNIGLEFRPSECDCDAIKAIPFTFQFSRSFSHNNVIMPAQNEKCFDEASRNKFLDYSAQLLQNRELSDVTLKIRGKELPAHKMMLSAASPVFKAMFDGDFVGTRHNVIEIDDIEPETINEMLKFIYTHDTPEFRSTSDGSIAVSLYRASHMYDIERLLDLCRNEILSTLGVETALDILALGDTYNDELMKSKALNFISQNPPSLEDIPKLEKITQERPQLLRDILACKFSQK